MHYMRFSFFSFLLVQATLLWWFDWFHTLTGATPTTGHATIVLWRAFTFLFALFSPFCTFTATEPLPSLRPVGKCKMVDFYSDMKPKILITSDLEEKIFFCQIRKLIFLMNLLKAKWIKQNSMTKFQHTTKRKKVRFAWIWLQTLPTISGQFSQLFDFFFFFGFIKLITIVKLEVLNSCIFNFMQKRSPEEDLIEADQLHAIMLLLGRHRLLQNSKFWWMETYWQNVFRETKLS